MTVFTPEFKLTINGVEYTDVAIADLNHEAGRTDIYSQPAPSYIQIELIALNNENYNLQVNDGITLQVKDSTNAFKTLPILQQRSGLRVALQKLLLIASLQLVRWLNCQELSILAHWLGMMMATRYLNCYLTYS
jgi:hypothetical protein